MLWLALHFQALPVAVFDRAAAAAEPLAVAERQGRRTRIAACNAAAATRGVQPGMAVAAAQALVCELVVRWRDVAAEDASLAGLAAWAGRFTPILSLKPPAGLLLEVGGSLSLHRGLDRLLGLVLSGLAGLGYAASHACAPTAQGAWLLARAGTRVVARDAQQLHQALAALPTRLLDQPPEVVEGLERIGALRLGDCLRLPRAGLAHRFGQGLLDELDRALGRVPEAQARFVPQPRFARRLELPTPVEEAPALVFAVHRLVPELEGWLALHQAGVQEIEIACYHQGAPATLLRLGFVEPTGAAERIQPLLRETLERTHLPAPVLAIALRARRTLPLAAIDGDLFQRRREGDSSLLLEHLRARLGQGAIQGLAPVADHRPELAWRTCPAGAAAAVPGKVTRPLWLLPEPRPCRDGRLVIEAGPERIESGWWDGREVARDYYVARDRHGARLWVYCERASGDWFVHGLFA